MAFLYVRSGCTLPPLFQALSGASSGYSHAGAGVSEIKGDGCGMRAQTVRECEGVWAGRGAFGFFACAVFHGGEVVSVACVLFEF